MIFIHSLRMLADLSVYFYFAELFVVSAGRTSQLIPMLLLSLCYGILVYMQKRNNAKSSACRKNILNSCSKLSHTD